MKRKTMMVCFFLVGTSAFSQEVIATQGDSYSNGSGSIDYTIGEVVISTGTDGTNDITQGFHQTNWNFLGVDDFAPEIKISIFPNPTENILNIQSTSYEEFDFVMIDAQGKIVMNANLTGETTSLNVSHLTTGTYNLIINANGDAKKNFRLVKHQ